MRQMLRNTRWRWLGTSAVFAACVSTIPFACDKAEPTGYLLDIRTSPPGDQLPTAVSVNCFKPGGYCLQNFAYPAPGKPLSYQAEDRLLTLAIEVENDFDQPRRLWVRARRDFETLGEYAAMLPAAEPGKQIKVDVMIQWGKLSDRDQDEVPDVIDDCPDKPDREQEGDCGTVSADGGALDASATDAKPDATPPPSDAAATDSAAGG